MKIYNAVVLLDYPGDIDKHYASMVFNKVKTIETRMRNILPMGSMVICCGKKSMTKYSGFALCIVDVAEGRPMVKADEERAKIESIPGRWAYELSNWRYFSRKFEFTKAYVSGSYQSVFQVRIPDNIDIL